MANSASQQHLRRSPRFVRRTSASEPQDASHATSAAAAGGDAGAGAVGLGLPAARAATAADAARARLRGHRFGQGPSSINTHFADQSTVSAISAPAPKPYGPTEYLQGGGDSFGRATVNHSADATAQARSSKTRRGLTFGDLPVARAQHEPQCESTSPVSRPTASPTHSQELGSTSFLAELGSQWHTQNAESESDAPQLAQGMADEGVCTRSDSISSAPPSGPSTPISVAAALGLRNSGDFSCGTAVMTPSSAGSNLLPSIPSDSSQSPVSVFSFDSFRDHAPAAFQALGSSLHEESASAILHGGDAVKSMRESEFVKPVLRLDTSFSTSAADGVIVINSAETTRYTHVDIQQAGGSAPSTHRQHSSTSVTAASAGPVEYRTCRYEFLKFVGDNFQPFCKQSTEVQDSCRGGSPVILLGFQLDTCGEPTLEKGSITAKLAFFVCWPAARSHTGAGDATSSSSPLITFETARVGDGAAPNPFFTTHKSTIETACGSLSPSPRVTHFLQRLFDIAQLDERLGHWVHEAVPLVDVAELDNDWDLGKSQWGAITGASTQDVLMYGQRGGESAELFYRLHVVKLHPRQPPAVAPAVAPLFTPTSVFLAIADPPAHDHAHLLVYGFDKKPFRKPAYNGTHWAPRKWIIEVTDFKNGPLRTAVDLFTRFSANLGSKGGRQSAASATEYHNTSKPISIEHLPTGTVLTEQALFDGSSPGSFHLDNAGPAVRDTTVAAWSSSFQAASQVSSTSSRQAMNRNIEPEDWTLTSDVAPSRIEHRSFPSCPSSLLTLFSSCATGA